MSSFSDDISDAVEKAIAETIAKHGGGFIEGYSLTLSMLDDDGEPNVYSFSPENQRMTTTLGLIEWARIQARVVALGE